MKGMTLILKGKNGNADVVLSHMCSLDHSFSRNGETITPDYIIEDESGKQIGVEHSDKVYVIVDENGVEHYEVKRTENGLGLVFEDDGEDEEDGFDDTPYDISVHDYTACCPWRAQGMRISDFF